jgi:beta-phosphoglucomutase-like phosphatase (HAD superfamily)
VGPIELDALIGGWHRAFEAAGRALASAGRDHDLDGGVLRIEARRLADERVAVVELLGSFAGDRYARPKLVRLVASPREAKQLLGLPSSVVACVFTLDGVLVPSSEVHAEAWKETFDEFLWSRVERRGGELVPFSRRADYPMLVYGRSRETAVRDFLASRGISLPAGDPGDPPGAQTVHGLANRKQQALAGQLEAHGVRAFAGARLFLQLARDAHLGCAVISSSTTTRELLERAGLAALVDEVVDGAAMLAEGLHRKPSPEMMVAACRRLGVAPELTAAFQSRPEGVDAGRAGRFAIVVAVAQEGEAEALRARGADLVVHDLGEILEQSLGG